MPKEPIFFTDKETKDLFLRAIELGMSNIKACEYASISEAVFYKWMKKGEDDLACGKTSKQSKYVAFIEDVKKARAKFQMRHLARITQASDNGSWQASAWLLERRCPDEYGQRADVNITNDKIVVVNDMPSKEEDDE